VYILGIHGNFGRAEHDGAAVLIKDNNIIAAVEEERFIRYKHSVGLMPDLAIEYCLSSANITMKDVDFIAFPRKTWKDFNTRFKSYLSYRFGYVPNITYVDHHTAHAASSYFISGFSQSLIITIDQAGDGISCGVYRGKNNTINLLEEIPFPHSLGLFAAFITQYLGFRSNHDEYKVMGLASYGKPSIDLSPLINFDGGNIHLNVEMLHPEVMNRYPIFHTDQLPMFRDKTYKFLPPPRRKNDPLLNDHKDLAASAQKVIEDALFALINKHKSSTDTHICIAGGVGENSVFNGKLAEKKMFTDIYVSPACGDSGSALGAALYVAVQKGFTFPKLVDNKLGPSYSNKYITDMLNSYRVSFTLLEDTAYETAKLLKKQHIVAWFQGKLEFGPRALGSRSLIADPSSEEMKKRVNQIKKREQFRPFAPSILDEHVKELFNTYQSSPFMSFTLNTNKKGQKKIVAATHIDHTGRIQTVLKDKSLYRLMIEEFYELTNIPAVLNTSLNSSWEPIIESPEQALAFFYSSEATALVIGNHLVLKGK